MILLLESAKGYTAKRAEHILSVVMGGYAWSTVQRNLRRGALGYGWNSNQSRKVSMGYPKGVKRCGVGYEYTKIKYDAEGLPIDQEILNARCRKAVPCVDHPSEVSSPEVVPEGA